MKRARQKGAKDKEEKKEEMYWKLESKWVQQQCKIGAGVHILDNTP
jgi:hypothetical protein